MDTNKTCSTLGKRPKWLFTVAMLFLVTACANLSSYESLANTPWQMRKAALSRLQSWQLSGRVSITSKQEGWHATLNWVQQGPAFTINLIGPLGQGRLRISSNGETVQLRTSDGKVFYATDADQLVEKTLGLRLPVNGLVYWVRGLPDPIQASVLAGDQQGRLTQLEQNGWIINYLRYAQQEQGAELPTRIRAYQDEWTVQMVIKNWNLKHSKDSVKPI
jgi:outer membrane lipoprotein LolB